MAIYSLTDIFRDFSLHLSVIFSIVYCNIVIKASWEKWLFNGLVIGLCSTMLSLFFYKEYFSFNEYLFIQLLILPFGFSWIKDTKSEIYLKSMFLLAVIWIFADKRFDLLISFMNIFLFSVIGLYLKKPLFLIYPSLIIFNHLTSFQGSNFIVLNKLPLLLGAVPFLFLRRVSILPICGFFLLSFTFFFANGASDMSQDLLLVFNILAFAVVIFTFYFKSDFPLIPLITIALMNNHTMSSNFLLVLVGFIWLFWFVAFQKNNFDEPWLGRKEFFFLTIIFFGYMIIINHSLEKFFVVLLMISVFNIKNQLSFSDKKSTFFNKPSSIILGLILLLPVMGSIISWKQ